MCSEAVLPHHRLSLPLGCESQWCRLLNNLQPHIDRFLSKLKSPELIRCSRADTSKFTDNNPGAAEPTIIRRYLQGKKGPLHFHFGATDCWGLPKTQHNTRPTHVVTGPLRVAIPNTHKYEKRGGDFAE